MAVNYNINPYGAGAVVLDQRPYLQFYQQQLARREAKEAALDNYFRDLGKNITPAGMRSQDVAGLTQKTNEWRRFYAQNKDAISNPRIDNGKAYTEYMSRYQDQLAHIEQSKRALKTTDELNKTRLNPNTTYILDDPGIIEKIQFHDLPIGDPKRKDIDIASLSVPPKPWGIKDREAYSKYLTAGLEFDEKPGKTEYLPGFKTRTPITKEYNQDNLRVIGQRAMGAYDTDKALQFQTNKLVKDVMSDPDKYAQLNSVYNRVYGKDAESPKELLAAQSILDENRKSVKIQEGKDEYGMQKALADMRHRNARELIAYRKSLDPNDAETNDLWVTEYVGKLKGEAMKRAPLPYKYASGTLVEEYDIPVDPVLGKALSVGNVEPDAVRVDKDGKFRRIFYQRYQEGDKIPDGKSVGDIKSNGGRAAVDETLSRAKLTQDQLELALGKRALTGKQLNKQMVSTVSGSKQQSSPGKKYTINGASYTKKQLNDMGYDDDEIDQAINAGIIK